MTLHIPDSLEQRLKRASQDRGILPEQLLEQALEAFLAPPVQEPRRNSKGFIVPSFVGVGESDDPTWIDQHEDLLWDNNGNHR